VKNNEDPEGKQAGVQKDAIDQSGFISPVHEHITHRTTQHTALPMVR
jgi:hypothetical protein